MELDDLGQIVSVDLPEWPAYLETSYSTRTFQVMIADDGYDLVNFIQEDLSSAMVEWLGTTGWQQHHFFRIERKGEVLGVGYITEHFGSYSSQFINKSTTKGAVSRFMNDRMREWREAYATNTAKRLLAPLVRNGRFSEVAYSADHERYRLEVNLPHGEEATRTYHPSGFEEMFDEYLGVHDLETLKALMQIAPEYDLRVTDTYLKHRIETEPDVTGTFLRLTKDRLEYFRSGATAKTVMSDKGLQEFLEAVGFEGAISRYTFRVPLLVQDVFIEVKDTCRKSACRFVLKKLNNYKRRRSTHEKSVVYFGESGFDEETALRVLERCITLEEPLLTIEPKDVTAEESDLVAA